MTSYSFNAEIPKLMNMIIHNFYSSKDIFIRELISNASDALDKVKYESLNNPQYLESTTEFSIKIQANKENNTFVIEDTGIGMTNDDLINCLGTIAKSGTEEFVKNMLSSDSNKSKLIGQFGVGFYSAFLISDRVQVFSKHPESDKVLLWESDAVSGYSISEVEDETLKRGSRMVLHVKPDQLEYLEDSKITEIVKKHSEFITYPIFLLKKTKVKKPVEKRTPVETEQAPSESMPEGTEQGPSESMSEGTEQAPSETMPEGTEQASNKSMPEGTEQVPSETMPESTEQAPSETMPEGTEQAPSETMPEGSEQVPSETMPEKTESGDVVIESDSDLESDNEEASKEQPEPETEEVTEIVYEKLNSESIWVKNPSEVTEEEYQRFYKSISSDYDDHQKVKHFKAEGNLEFSSILYIPKHAPHDMFEKKQEKANIKLYVKKVLITDKCTDLYPEYFSFISGVVDCPDLQLNASRELLQQSKVTKQISKILVKKTIEMFNELSENEEEYKKFYSNFSRNLKLAIHEDKMNKDKLLELLRFTTSKSDENQIKLDSYIENMKESQSGIYFINSDSLVSAKSSPLIEKLVSSGFEVIYMTEPIDEYLMQNVKEYKDKKFINVANDDLKLDLPEDTTDKSTDEICSKLKELLGDKVEKVVVSKKLVSQPAIVTSASGMSANMERIMKAQALGNTDMLKFMAGRRTLEINPSHTLIKKIVDNNYNDVYVSLLFDMGQLAGGYQLDNMNDFLSKVYSNLA
jgi:molecular chaperone HtpG